jgi:tRNA (cmo5U34)-methyltransferase
MLTTQDGKAVHMPANPDRFEFDAEVAVQFPEMAHRSIPNYHQAHRMHAEMCSHLLWKPGAKVLDVGASRAGFFTHIRNTGATPQYTALDCSQPMLDLVAQEFPEADILNMDLTSTKFVEWAGLQRFDVVCCNYVLQFLPVNEQYRVLDLLSYMVAPGGMFFLGHKVQHRGSLGALMHEEYLRFREENGYSRAEIEAKTRALKGSMFPMVESLVKRHLSVHFSEVEETTRFAMFSTLAAVK